MAATKTSQKLTLRYTLTAGGNYSKNLDGVGDPTDPYANQNAVSKLTDYGKIVAGTSKSLDVAVVNTYEPA